MIGAPGQQTRLPIDTTADSSWILPSCNWNYTGGFWNTSYISKCEDIPGFFNPNDSSTFVMDGSVIDEYYFNLGNYMAFELGRVHVWNVTDTVGVDCKLP